MKSNDFSACRGMPSLPARVGLPTRAGTWRPNQAGFPMRAGVTQSLSRRHKGSAARSRRVRALRIGAANRRTTQPSKGPCE